MAGGTSYDRDNVKIKGGDANAYNVDVISESGLKKLVVKSSTVPAAVGSILVEHAINSGSSDLNVNGSGTPVVFTIESGTYEKQIRELRFYGNAAGISYGKFLSLNSALTNGILLELQSSEQEYTHDAIKYTEDFGAGFALGRLNWQMQTGAGLDNFIASWTFDTPFPIKPTGTYATDDYIKITIRDDLSAISRLQFLAFGYEVI